jgi:hypothetical protein
MQHMGTLKIRVVILPFSCNSNQVQVKQTWPPSYCNDLCSGQTLLRPPSHSSTTELSYAHSDGEAPGLTRLKDTGNFLSPWGTYPYLRLVPIYTASALDLTTESLRPVSWILSSGSRKGSTVIVIGPYEVKCAASHFPEEEKSLASYAQYAPRVTSSMRFFSDLTFYTIPETPAEP